MSYSDGIRTLVDRVDLTIEPGAVTVLLGSAESGLATLLRLICGELAPTRGRIVCDEALGVTRLPVAGGLDGRSATAPSIGVPYVVVEEPARNRDVACRIVRACARFATRGAGVIAALHDVDLAAAFADRIVLMHGGEVVADGAPEIVLDPAFVRCVFGPPCSRARLAR